jgi:hypothetical protein
MTHLRSELRAYFEETTDPLTVEEILARRILIVGGRPGGLEPSESPWATWWSGPRLAAAAALAAVVFFAAVASLFAGPEIEVGGVDSAEVAAEVIEELHRAVAERNGAVVNQFFGETVVLNSYLGLDFAGPDSAEYLMRISVPMTVEDIGEPVDNGDDSFTIVVTALAEMHRYPEAWTYRVLMDGTEVVAVDLESIDPVAP